MALITMGEFTMCLDEKIAMYIQKKNNLTGKKEAFLEKKVQFLQNFFN